MPILLTNDGEVVKKRSRMFSFLVGSVTSWVRAWSRAYSSRRFDCVAWGFPGVTHMFSQSMWGRLKSQAIQRFLSWFGLIELIHVMNFSM